MIDYKAAGYSAFPFVTLNPTEGETMQVFNEQVKPGQIIGHEGMTLRDYFAAKAMQALIASDGKIAQMCKEAGIEPLEAVPIAAYSMADAMIEMREKM